MSFRLSITVCLCFLLSLTGGHAARVEWEWRLPAFLAASTGLHLLLRQEDAPWSLGKSLQVFQTCRCLLGFQSRLIVSSDCALNNTDCGESGQNLEWLIVFLLSALWLKDSSSWREAEGGEGGGNGMWHSCLLRGWWLFLASLELRISDWVGSTQSFMRQLSIPVLIQ